ncbi:hypothetical protein KEM52_006186 [Ascosphaera acerosa]|nr:hypothetical protein KEM52_006186 [Ascosphaera acerosa]
MGLSYHRGLGWNEIGLRGRDVPRLFLTLWVWDLIFVASITALKVASLSTILSEVKRARVRTLLWVLIFGDCVMNVVLAALPIPMLRRPGKKHRLVGLVFLCTIPLWASVLRFAHMVQWVLLPAPYWNGSTEVINSIELHASLWILSLRYLSIAFRASVGLQYDPTPGAIPRSDQTACFYDYENQADEAAKRKRNSMQTVGSSFWHHKLHPALAYQIMDEEQNNARSLNTQSSMTQRSDDTAQQKQQHVHPVESDASSSDEADTEARQHADCNAADFVALSSGDGYLVGTFKVRVSSPPMQHDFGRFPTSWMEEAETPTATNLSSHDESGISMRTEIEVQRQSIDWNDNVTSVGRFRVKSLTP